VSTTSSNSPTHRDQLGPGRIRKRSIGLAGAVAQSAALIGPTGGVVLGLAFIGSLAGAATPLSFVIAVVICLCIAKVIGEYARHIPAAGSFYAYLTQTFGARTGFVTGMLLFGAYFLLFPFQLDFFGSYVSNLGQAHGFTVPWWIYAVALMLFSTVLAILGIKPTLRFGLITLAFEMLVLTVLAVIIIAKGGADGNTLSVFNPSSSTHGTSDLLLSVVYTLFAFVGFESAATLGEEAKDPRRTIPRAIMVSTLVVGAFFVFTSYAAVIGFGVSAEGIDQMTSDAAPLNTLATRFGGETLSAFVNSAVIVSIIAVNLVTVPAISRMLYAMGRDRVLPERLGKLSKRDAPQFAILVLFVVVVATSLISGGIWGPENIAAWSSFFATLFFIGAYLMLCVGIIFYMRRHHRDEFSWLSHGVVPLIALAGIVWVLYGNVHPLPASPFRYFIWATIALAILAAIAAEVLDRVNPDIMIRAGRILTEEADA
jgi:amino acid transporter